MTFGGTLRALRGARSLREVATAAGLDHVYLWRIERGEKRGGGKPKLESLARALGCDVGVLMLAAELDDGITVRVERLPEAAKVLLRALAAGVEYPLSFWEAVRAMAQKERL